MAALREEVTRARLAGLMVIVDAHPRDAYRARYFASAVEQQRFAAMWREIIQVTARDGVFFELMNEPGNAAWWPIQGRLLAQLRTLTAAPLIANGDNSGSLPDLIRHAPYKIPRVIYNFHFYNPMTYTHQGAPWDAKYRALHDIPYAGDALDRAKTGAQIAAAAAWRDLYRVPLTCDEYGAWAAAPSRERYLWDVSAALDSAGISRTLWQNGGFAVRPSVPLLRGQRP